MKTAKNTTTPRIFTTYDIGRMTGTDPTTVHKWIDKGLLRGYRTPGGHRRVRAEDLRSFLVAHRIPIPRELGGADTLRVMLVDEDAELTKSLLRAFKRQRPGWEVNAVGSGVDALLELQASMPDVLVLGLPLPDADALTICRSVRARPETANIQVLAMGARITADLEKKATAAGAHGCLKKPLAPAEMIEAVELAAGIRPAHLS